MRLALLAVLLTAVLCTASAARILVLAPFPGKSHYIYLTSILKALAEKGHEIVMYTPVVPKKPLTNITHVYIRNDMEKEMENWTFEDFKKLIAGGSNMLGIITVWSMFGPVMEKIFQLESIQQLLRSDEHFDLVITESTFAQESLLVFGHRFKAPVISLQGSTLQSVINRDAGNDLATASIPDMASLVDTEQMSFFTRVLNLLFTSVTLAVYNHWHLPAANKIVQQYYPRDLPPPPPVQDLVTNISLLFYNAHPGIAYVQPVTPNLVPIAGITISDDRTPLPPELKKWMDEAEEGVVYFSLGTVVPAHKLPADLLQIFAKVFSRLKQKVLWKIELDSVPGLTSNVRLEKWVPQPGVLAHPNTRLFMTHGGLLSQQEVLHAGVPTVGIPFFGDQPYNVMLSEYRGFGVKLDFNTLSEQSVYNAVTTVLDNPRYRETAQRLSRIFRDRPLSPRDTVVYWTEYVLRHKGAAHLRPVSSKMPWYQVYLLDVVAFLFLVSAVAITLTYLVTRRILAAVVARLRPTQVPSSKKKN